MFTWDANGTAGEARIFHSREAFEWVKANLPVHDRIHRIEFFEEPSPKAVVHRYPGKGSSKYDALEPPLEVPLEALPPENLRPGFVKPLLPSERSYPPPPFRPLRADATDANPEDYK